MVMQICQVVKDISYKNEHKVNTVDRQQGHLFSPSVSLVGVLICALLSSVTVSITDTKQSDAR